MIKNIDKITTLGQLKAENYTPKKIKDEIRDNLITQIKDGSKMFPGILGYDDTVLPDLKRALLSRHNILLLGLRGQAKTRLARLMGHFLDPYIPVIAGSEINDDPLQPISRYARDLIAEQGDDTPVTWLAREERYVEKLATPDVSIADLVGDVDPIKAASLKLPFSDERVIHFGLIPRAHRSIFVINELPDLQARIQVSLFNILQEEDMQIRGFKLRLPLDIQFVFTANPEDYTNRGSIITPLKDRIESQVLTHYPTNIEDSASITTQEAQVSEVQADNVEFFEEMLYLIECFVVAVRGSEYVDEKSGVSARMNISAYESIYSTAELRMLEHGEKKTSVRVGDVWGLIPAFTGKAELVYEGEQLGYFGVAFELIQDATAMAFDLIVGNAEVLKEENSLKAIVMYFEDNNHMTLEVNESNADYTKKLKSVPGLEKLAQLVTNDKSKIPFVMELILHGLAAKKVINVDHLVQAFKFGEDVSDLLDDLTDFGPGGFDDLN